MFIESENELENYICENIDDFIDFLKRIYENDNFDIEKIKFVGRQIIIANSRIDLLFEVKERIEGDIVEFQQTFIVVELKFRKAEPKDIAQLSRYLNLLNCLECDERVNNTFIQVKGLLLTKGLDNDMQEMQIYFNDFSNTDIKFAHIETKLNYINDSYSYKDDFLKNMSLDDRFDFIKQEVFENGEEENDRP